MTASEFTNRPKLQLGGLLVYASSTERQPKQTISFQFNPESLKRGFALRAKKNDPHAKKGDAVEDALRLEGPPVETISLSLDLDAIDALEENRDTAREDGLHRVLAALEMLLYPTKKDQNAQQQAAQSGKVMIAAGNVPLIIFVWGKHRAVPVKLTTFSVSEDLFDESLNPIRAKVDISMTVLTDYELQEGTGVDAYRSYQRSKERLAGGLAQSYGQERVLLPQAPAFDK